VAMCFSSANRVCSDCTRASFEICISRVYSSFGDVPIFRCSCFTASENLAVAALYSFTRRAFSSQLIGVGIILNDVLRISLQVLCPEYSRLLQQYEAALRRRVQVEWSSNEASAGIKEKRALDERDAARERLNLHERSCPTCIHNQHNPHLVK
jgi:hypothetical protein